MRQVSTLLTGQIACQAVASENSKTVLFSSDELKLVLAREESYFEVHWRHSYVSHFFLFALDDVRATHTFDE